MSAEIVLLGLGARAALGSSPAALEAAYAAGLTRHRESRALLTRAGKPLIVAADPHLPAETPVRRRIAEMIGAATEQAISSVAVPADARVDLLLALPEPRIGADSDFGDRAVAAATRALAPRARTGETTVLSAGRTGAIGLLAKALDRLSAGESAACLWGGVDSHLGLEILDSLDLAGRLHAGGARWGFIPGEGAAACLLARADVASSWGVDTWGVVRAAATADSASPDRGEEIASGLALTAATEQALSALPTGERIHRISADLNGERARVDDVGFTMTRIAGHLASVPCLETPADRLGEAGAAFAPLSLVLSAVAARQGRLPGPNVLLWTTGPGPSCGAALVTLPIRERP